MKIWEIVKETASCGGTSSGAIATVTTPMGIQPKEGQFFGGDPASSIYGPIKANRRKRKKVQESEEDDEVPERGPDRPDNEGNWYLRVDGKNLKDERNRAIPFTKHDANRKAYELATKKNISLDRMHLTRSWMDVK